MSKKINDVSDAVIVIDQNGIIETINPVASDMFGYEKDELLWHPISEILPPSGQYWAEQEGLVFEILRGKVESIYKKGIKKNGLVFPVDVFIVPFRKDGKQHYDCVIKDDSSRFFHERMETLSNVILRRVLIGENLDHFASFILEQLFLVFPYPLLWVGKYDKDEKGVVVLSSMGTHSSMAPVGTLYTHQACAIHPTVLACEKMEMTYDEVKDENGNNYKLMAFPFLSKRDVGGVLCVLAPSVYLNHLILNRLENIALRLGMILQISEDQKSLRLLGTAISSAMNAVFITDARGKIIWTNDAFSKLSGHAKESVIGRMPDFLYSGIHPPEFYQKMWHTIKSGKSWRGEMIDRRKDGSLFTIEQMITPILDKDGKITHYVAVNDDLTARKDAEGKIRHLSNYDQLTGLPNRSLFHEKLREIIAKKAKSPQIVAVLFLDLSSFSRFNDTMGHAAGDQILKTTAERLVASVPSGDLVARINGDEYAIVLQDLTKADEAGIIAHRIIRAVQQPFFIDKTEVVIGSYIGISLYPIDDTNPEKLTNYADMALVKAKTTAPNTYFYFSQKMNQEIEDRLVLERDMRRALANKEFFLNYQPQVDIKTGKVLGWEALVRWQHPTRGLIPPNLFISVAEDTRMITPLCEFVLEEALTQLKIWQTEGFGKLTMAVNLSAAQFEDENLLDTVQKLLKQTKVKAHSLELELTESLLMKDAAAGYALLTALSQMGVRIAIDDFGTGYSSLSYLGRLPVDKLKVDRSFVQEMKIKENAEIVRAIITLGHVLGLEVVAEGVENAEQLALLKKMKCDSIQGFYFGKPMRAEQATAYLKEKNLK